MNNNTNNKQTTEPTPSSSCTIQPTTSCKTLENIKNLISQVQGIDDSAAESITEQLVTNYINQIDLILLTLNHSELRPKYFPNWRYGQILDLIDILKSKSTNTDITQPTNFNDIDIPKKHWNEESVQKWCQVIGILDSDIKHIRDNNIKGSWLVLNKDNLEKELKEIQVSANSAFEIYLKFNPNPGTQDQINDLLNREITPEDYELLCLLDSTVKPKTISQDIIEELPTIRYTEQFSQFPSCMICLFNFESNEDLTKLPCSHIFHINCISSWLANASTKCPIDNVPIHDH
ncbi:hypothetical protein DLAC_08539 [Tieghemostelium lacteum]|uniref:RING-type domain-containing protein n=1 Tax=Tieghemostelium lacteum TaxID=361077 RepID=A0A151Z7M8_TIELA|nr:hypothetical protein DLAC_08539 [Tieghemostelium lacteum]|eukprot:KYQ89969.1 hypothetical protein DLAC_08539 [Tieghemostelium lacteum]